MRDEHFFRGQVDGVVVALVYLVEGSGMGNEKSVLQNVYIGKSKAEVDNLICAKYNIADGNLKNWISRSWASVVYHGG